MQTLFGFLLWLTASPVQPGLQSRAAVFNMRFPRWQCDAHSSHSASGGWELLEMGAPSPTFSLSEANSLEQAMRGIVSHLEPVILSLVSHPTCSYCVPILKQTDSHTI